MKQYLWNRSNSWMSPIVICKSKIPSNFLKFIFFIIFKFAIFLFFLLPLPLLLSLLLSLPPSVKLVIIRGLFLEERPRTGGSLEKKSYIRQGAGTQPLVTERHEQILVNCVQIREYCEKVLYLTMSSLLLLLKISQGKTKIERQSGDQVGESPTRLQLRHSNFVFPQLIPRNK